jgi:hypothetical protein
VDGFVALFERGPNRLPIRHRDLRATFVTTSLANGKTETWVADRTGHKSSTMINRYRRRARTHRELGLGPLAPLVAAIPELAVVAHPMGQRVGQKPQRTDGPAIFENEIPEESLLVPEVGLETEAVCASLGWRCRGRATAQRRAHRHALADNGF